MVNHLFLTVVEYFRLMIANAWGLEGNTTYNNKKKGWSNKDEEGGQNPSEGYSKRFGKKEQKPKENLKKLRSKNKPQEEEQGEDAEIDQSLVKPIHKLREVLKRRGGGGIIGLSRQFKIFDDDRSGQLDENEFVKAMKDFQVGLTDAEVKQVFHKIDRDGSGLIDYEEFLRKVRGKMNDKRKQIVLQVFDKLDVDGSGVSHSVFNLI